MAERTITLKLEIDGRQVEARLKSTDALVRQLRQQLATAGAEGQRSGKQIAQALDAIERELKTGTITSLRQANDALRQLDELFLDATDQETRTRIASLSTQLQGVRSNMMAAATATKAGFNPATMQLVRLVQDAQYGFLGMANNLQELITQLALSARGGAGLGGALKSLAVSLVGPAGIVAALSALIAFGPQLWNWFSNLIGLSKESEEQLKKLREELEKVAGAELGRLFGELSIEELERLRKAHERLLKTRERSVELHKAELDRLKERREELAYLLTTFGRLNEEQQRELEELQRRIPILEQQYDDVSEALARQQAIYDAINKQLEEARLEQEAQAALQEAAARAGVKTAEQKERESEAARAAAEAAKEEAEARERAAKAARKTAEALREYLAARRASEAERAERRRLRDEGLLPPPDLDFGRELFTLEEDVRRMMQEGIGLEDVFSGLDVQIRQVESALQAAREELDKLKAEGKNTSEIEQLIAALEETHGQLTTLQAISSITADAMAQAMATAAEAIGASLAGVQGAIRMLGDSMQLIVADLASSLAALFRQMAVAAAAALQFGKAAALLAASFALGAIAGAIRGRVRQRQERRQAVRMADGGLVEGPGGPRDDRIPALLSRGEYVVQARAAEKAAPLLELINRRPDWLDASKIRAAMALIHGQRPAIRMADGGLVGSVRVPAVATAIAPGRLDVRVRVEGELLGRGRELVGVIRKAQADIRRLGA